MALAVLWMLELDRRHYERSLLCSSTASQSLSLLQRSPFSSTRKACA
ncbi:MAG: hypothetical protein MH252_04620 [Thermosynechococcaceae cyanobacterium MS004]|nr:hypothetical protein [Thermosynechococcaceae cyanobacterium MS004]